MSAWIIVPLCIVGYVVMGLIVVRITYVVSLGNMLREDDPDESLAIFFGWPIIVIFGGFANIMGRIERRWDKRKRQNFSFKRSLHAWGTSGRRGRGKHQ